MEAYEIIELIRTSEKKTPVRVTLQERKECVWTDCECFRGGNGLCILFGDWKKIAPQLEAQKENISALQIENNACNSAIPMLDLKNIHARIEPGAILREGVEMTLTCVLQAMPAVVE